MDHMDSEGEEGELASEEEDPDLHRGDPNLTQLVGMEEEQRYFYNFALASLGVQGRKGKTLYGRFPRRILNSILNLSRFNIRLIQFILARPNH